MCGRPILADDERATALLPAPETELVWEALSREGVEAYGSGRRQEAATLWRRADELAATFAADDPRRAAGDNNLAIGRWIEGDSGAAETLFCRALDGWEAADVWIAGMAVRGAARSSLFHLRLETRHRDQFEIHLRHRVAGLCGGGAAATIFNLGAFLVGQADAGEADIGETGVGEATIMAAEAIERRTAAFGSRDPALLGMLAFRARLCAAEGQGEEATQLTERRAAIEADPARPTLLRWIEDRPQALDDERRALAAAYLACLVGYPEIP